MPPCRQGARGRVLVCGCGPHQPRAFFLDGPSPRARSRSCAGDELRKDGCNEAGPGLGAEANEIILLNSHDGTSSYQMLAGMLRFVCKNGLVCGDAVADVRRIRDKANAMPDRRRAA